MAVLVPGKAAVTSTMTVSTAETAQYGKSLFDTCYFSGLQILLGSSMKEDVTLWKTNILLL